MKLTLSPDKLSWDRFAKKHPLGSFLVSWAWGDFQMNLGNKVWRLQIKEEDEVLSQGLIIKLGLGFGKYLLYSPHPLFINKELTASQQEKLLTLVLKELKELKKEAILVRFDPAETANDKLVASLYRSLGFKKSSKYLQPRYINVLPIDNKKKFALLHRMKPKTRYNLQLAERKGVTVRESHSPKDLETFLKLLKATSRRGKFKPHQKSYFRKQFEILSRQNMQSLFLAEYQNKILAAALVNFFGEKAYYTHGASADDLRNLMASYLLHWQIILSAQEKGCTVYELGGVNPNPNHPWAGITRFKEGFGGETRALLPTMELPLQNLWYRLYHTLRG